MSLDTEAATKGFITKTFYIRKSPNSKDSINVVVNGSAVAFKPVGDPAATGVYGEVQAENLYASNAARFSLAFAGAVKAVYQQAAETKSTKTEWEYNGNTLGYSEDGFAHKYAESQKITLPSINTTTDLPTTLAAGEDSGVVLTLADSTPVEVTLRIWIEGWDNECHANILKQSFSVAFGFEKAE